MNTGKPIKGYEIDFACVGFPKCATTFILERFSEYSFDTLVDGELPIKHIYRHRQKISDLHKMGIKVAIKNPIIIYNKNTIDKLMRSGCKIIISLRNPVCWLKSFYNYRLERINQGLEHLPAKFDEIPTFDDIVYSDLNFMDVSVMRGMMAKIITKNLLESKHYDPSRVLYVIQEEFETEHDKVQNELLDFLEIPKSSRVKRVYNFEYDKPIRWKFFDTDEYDQTLYETYADEIRDICSIVNSHTGKDLKSIWEKYYSIKIDS